MPDLNSYPVGSIAVCRFAFTLRPLTDDEQTTFLEGRGLPSGAGYSPAIVQFHYDPPGGPETVLTGGGVTVDGAGAYHVNLTVSLPGMWRYWGIGEGPGGDPQASTLTHFFRGVHN